MVLVVVVAAVVVVDVVAAVVVLRPTSGCLLSACGFAEAIVEAWFVAEAIVFDSATVMPSPGGQQ